MIMAPYIKRMSLVLLCLVKRALLVIVTLLPWTTQLESLVLMVNNIRTKKGKVERRVRRRRRRREEEEEEGRRESCDDLSGSEDDDLQQLVETLQNFVRDSSESLSE